MNPAQLPLQSTDYTTDLSFDFYGQRLAVGSQDHMVRVFAKTEATWLLESILVGHKGPIVSLAWANPDFGSLLASCSQDRTTIVWEEWSSTTSQKTWKRLATLGERDYIVAVAFAPRHCGLRLATCSSDAWIRIYQAVDSSKQQWTLRESFRASDSEEGVGDASSLAWNSSPYDRPSLLVGAVDPPRAAVWSFAETRKKWRRCALLQGHEAGVNHVAWANTLGRSFHLLATASSDKTARIWRLRRTERGEENEVLLGEDDNVEVECLQTLVHPDEVWRVEWNVTGTVLATSCEDGAVRCFSLDQGKGLFVLDHEIKEEEDEAAD